MNYLLVLPDYRAIGFSELKDADRVLHIYFEDRIDIKSEQNIYSQYDMYEEKSRDDISYVIGAEEGWGKIYDIDDLIENIQESDMFQDEKEDIIRELLKNNINFDISKYEIENILVNTKTY